MQSLSLADLYAAIGHYFWPFTRTLALFAAAPLFSEKVAAKRVKIGLALLVAWLIGETLPATPVALLSVAGVWITAKQIAIGYAMGLTMQFLFAAVRSAGEIVGLQMGLSFASFYDPSGNQSMPVLARIFNVLFTLLFITLNGHLLLLDALAESFRLLPVNGAPLGNGGFYLLAQAAGAIFSSGLKMGLPIVTLLLALNLALGLLNRLTPQLSVFVIGFPLSITLGMGALLVMMMNFAPLFAAMMQAAFHQLMAIVQGLQPA
ncbi:flagellar biosynthetic protein FliR [Pantoea latae]|uniref:Flagellar biosynthetic protein FliR n=1 Tax=Pantoea latae TaxID=1964541 RepID=A0A1V9DNF7_9GAMM|nr:flagellar biosynthetic protein FliR [Pantoea latae]OQP35388.1 flagellar biosynthetic protein FliR [Pantoea latae]